MPRSSSRHPYRAAIDFVTSATSGISMRPSPPWDRGTRVQARWDSGVSVDAATSWQLSAANSDARSLNAMISVGHTNVKS